MLTKASTGTLVCSSLAEGGAACSSDVTCASASCVQGSCAPVSLLVSANEGSGNSGSSRAATAGGIAVAVILCVCVLTFVAFMVYRRRQKRVVVVKPINNDANYEFAGSSGSMTPLPQQSDVAISVEFSEEPSYARGDSQ